MTKKTGKAVRTAPKTPATAIDTSIDTSDVNPPALTSPAETRKPEPAPSETASTEPASVKLPDMEALSTNLARLVGESGKVVSAYLKPLESGKSNSDMAEHVADAVKTLGRVAECWLTDPQKTLEAQSALSQQFISLWSQTLQRLQGETVAPVVPVDKSDKRFADPEWQSNPYFDFMRQAYLIGTSWANDIVAKTQGLDPFEKQKAEFYLRQISGAISPSNFLATNPEVLRETLAQNGENLVRGLHMLAQDIEAGKGQVKIRQSDSSKLVLGVDMANTPGKVVFRNDLIELIQYAPTTEQVYRRPLLILPPWINKFYVLDLNKDKSFIRWCVAQGLTVFIVSWVNPDERHADKDFEAYMKEGIFAALTAIEAATGEHDIATMGYCVGGTLLAVSLAYMATKQDDRIRNATFLTTQVDFTDAGDLKVFVDAERIKTLEENMAHTGYLEGARMAAAFNMLRPSELIWSYAVNNYLKGKEPLPFDLLSWNSDSTRMPAANHAFYLRHCYLQNDLSNGRMQIGDVTIHLDHVKIPIYELAAKEDHIAPALSVFTGAKLFGGDVRYVLSGSGHIAGVVNPADKPKYQYWTGTKPQGSFEDWLSAAREHPGSWWSDWLDWMKQQAPDQVSASTPGRVPGSGGLKAICDAPGEYVRVKA